MKKILHIAATIALGVLAVFIAARMFAGTPQFFPNPQLLPEELILPQPSKAEVQEPAVVSPPLRAVQEEIQSFLTKSGILIWTNVNRITNNLPPLSENSVLDRVAQKKLEDMFENQYFAHVSPAGKDVSGLAKEAGYEFLTVGENLALGNFKDDKTLIQAWMDSPGHRANILGARYTEIGIATARGVYEDRETWLAVQTFALPLSACPTKPSSELLSQIDANNNQLTFYSVELESRNADIEGSDKNSGAKYAVKVKEYNAMIEKYNELLNQTKALVAEYNEAITAFNACLQGP